MATAVFPKPTGTLDMSEPHTIGIITYVGDINAEFVNFLLDQIQSFKPLPYELILNLSSPGGSTIHGVTAYNLLKSLTACVVHTHNMGEVSSAAILPFLAGRIRTTSPVAKFMFHPVAVSFDGVLSYPKAQELLTMMEHDITNYSAIVAKEIPDFCKEHPIDSILRHNTIILPSADGQMYDLITP